MVIDAHYNDFLRTHQFIKLQKKKLCFFENLQFTQFLVIYSLNIDILFSF